MASFRKLRELRMLIPANLKDKHLILLLFFVAGLLCLPVPLVGYFHYDSAVLFSLLGTFTAVWYTSRNNTSFRDLIWLGGSVLAAGIPLATADIIRGWFTVDALAYWLFIPFWSVLLAASLTRFIKQFTRFGGVVSALILIIIAVISPLTELLTQPKVYFFNPVWGYFPGPIYDETLLFDPRLMFYRLGTLGWIGLLWMLPSLSKSRIYGWLTALSGLLAISVWLFYGMFGITRSEKSLQKNLSSQINSKYLVVHFDPGMTDSSDVYLFAKWADVYTEYNAEKMGVDENHQRINWYLYADPWIKKQLVGAKYTQYVPVWLRQDQIHVDETSVMRALEHELIHVLAKQWTNNLLGASWSIGLTEGLAKALETDWESDYTNSELVAARDTKPSIREIVQMLCVTGFYRLNSGSAYTTAGAFVEFLLESGREEELKTAYKKSSVVNLAQADLNTEWESFLSKQEVDSSTRRRSNYVFSGQSIFEKSAPRVATTFEQIVDDVRRYITRNKRAEATDLLKVVRFSEDLSSEQQSYLTTALMSLSLRAKQPKSVIELSGKSEDRNHKLMRADALILTGDTTSAKKIFRQVKNQAAGKDSLAITRGIEGREDVVKRKSYLSAYYGYWDNVDLAFEKYPWLTLQTAINQGNENLAISLVVRTINQEDPGVPSRYTIYKTVSFLIKAGEAEIVNIFMEKFNSVLENDDTLRKMTNFIKSE